MKTYVMFFRPGQISHMADKLAELGQSIDLQTDEDFDILRVEADELIDIGSHTEIKRAGKTLMAVPSPVKIREADITGTNY